MCAKIDRRIKRLQRQFKISQLSDLFDVFTLYSMVFTSHMVMQPIELQTLADIQIKSFKNVCYLFIDLLLFIE